MTDVIRSDISKSLGALATGLDIPIPPMHAKFFNATDD